MANENFGLSYTVSSPALWNDDFEGKISEAGTIYTPFAPGLPALGEAGTLDTTGLCGLNLLSLPGQSTLSGPETSIMSCP